MTQEDINDLMIINMPQWHKEQLYIQNRNKELLNRLINAAVKQEREEIISMIQSKLENTYKYNMSDFTITQLTGFYIEAIRQRGESDR